MIRVILRNRNKNRGKVLFVGYYSDTVNNYLNGNLRAKLQELNKIDDDFKFIDEDDFIDIEKNGKDLIYTFYNGVDRFDLQSAIHNVNQEIKSYY